MELSTSTLVANRSLATPQVRRLKKREYELAQRFYAANGAFSVIQSIDQVLGAFVGGELVGAIRVGPEYGSYTLRGLFVLESHRGMGIGGALLKSLTKYLRGKECYCLCAQSMMSFFEPIGFQEMNSENAPDHLKKRLASRQQRDASIILMRLQG